MKKCFSIIFVSLCLVCSILTLSACVTESQDYKIDIETGKRIIDVDEGVLYISYDSFEDALNDSDMAVLGTIKEIKEPHFPSYDTNCEIIATPIVIEIESVDKGHNYKELELHGKELVFDITGGETDEIIYMTQAYPTNSLKVGDSVYVFLKLDSRYDTYRVISPNMIFVADENQNIKVDMSMVLEANEAFYRHDGDMEDTIFSAFIGSIASGQETSDGVTR